jgi:3-hydroxyacyl-CoA dehydrogenase
MTQDTVTVIGLGLMGSALAKTLLAAGLSEYSALAQFAARVGRGAGLDGRFVECMQAYATETLEAGYGTVSDAVMFNLFRQLGEN